jgi:hypothetical protein
VHAAQWGTLNRLVHAVLDPARTAAEGWAIDEHTTLETDAGIPVAVHGTGAAAYVCRTGDTAAVAVNVAGALHS